MHGPPGPLLAHTADPPALPVAVVTSPADRASQGCVAPQASPGCLQHAGAYSRRVSLLTLSPCDALAGGVRVSPGLPLRSGPPGAFCDLAAIPAGNWSPPGPRGAHAPAAGSLMATQIAWACPAIPCPRQTQGCVSSCCVCLLPLPEDDCDWMDRGRITAPEGSARIHSASESRPGSPSPWLQGKEERNAWHQ